MEVKISFDTEKESLMDLKKFISYIQGIIERREGGVTQVQGMNASLQTRTEQQKVQVPASGQTFGGGRVIPYEDMSAKLSEILSRRY